MTSSLTQLPDHLPIPVDDGACHHLLGSMLPSVNLLSTQGHWVNIAKNSRIQVIYCYPMTGRPDHPLPHGWDQIPGARGCTPQACSFRDHYQDLQSLGVDVYGISTQSHLDQREAATRLHLPFALLSDEELAFTQALQLPTFEIDGKILIKRLTLITELNRIQKVFYPVFPPVDILPSLSRWLPLTRAPEPLGVLEKGVDSFCKTLMSKRENIGGGIDVAVVECTALHTPPFPYS